MEDKSSRPTYGLLEQHLAQRIQVLYITELGHKPNKVACQLLDKTLTITIENPITQPERLLVESGKQEFAEQLRSNIHKAFQPQLKALIEEVLGASIIEMLGDSQLQTCRTSIIAVLAATPQKVKQHTMFDLNSDQ